MSLLKNVIKLGSANVALLAAQIATVIALGLVVEPEAFAVFLLGLSIAQPFAAFAMLRFDSAIPSAQTRRDLSGLLVLASASLLILALLEYTGVFVLRTYELFELQSLPTWGILVVVLITMSLSAAQLGRYWAIRHMNLAVIERATYSRAALIFVLRGAVILGVLYQPQVLSGLSAGIVLLVAELVASFFTAVLLRPKSVDSTEKERPEKEPLDLPAVRSTLRANWKFPLLETPSAIVDSFLVHAPIFVVTQFFGLTATASFGLAFRALAVPIGQLSLALTEVMQSHYSEHLRKNRLADFGDLFRRSSLALLVLGVVGCIVIYFVLEKTVVMIAGEKMREFAILCVTISPWIAMNVLVNINSRLLPLLKRQELKLVYDAFGVVVLLAVIFLQIRLQLDLVPFVAMLTAAKVAAYVVYWFLIRSAVRNVIKLPADSNNPPSAST
ncbi:MAG: lipopolysaccharide biosynthesis protein [Gammaproteobacteria bacterium]